MFHKEAQFFEQNELYDFSFTELHLDYCQLEFSYRATFRNHYYFKFYGFL